MKSLRLSTRLALITWGSIVTVVAVVVAISYFSSKAELTRLAQQDQEMRIKTFWSLLEQRGREFRLDGDRLLVGDYVINGNYELPDKLKTLCGGTLKTSKLEE